MFRFIGAVFSMLTGKVEKLDIITDNYLDVGVAASEVAKDRGMYDVEKQRRELTAKLKALNN
jgi:hypothetical protein